MKRSRSVRLTLMGAAVATTGGLSGCGDDVPVPGNYPSVENCVGAGNVRKACESARDNAYKAHEEKAPRYATQDECLKAIDVTSCTETRVRQPDGSFVTMFVPALAGFMIARAIQQPTYYTGGGTSGGGTYYGGSPYYASRDYPTQYRDGENLRTSRTGTFGAGSQPSSLAPTISRPPNVSTTTIARGGFGSSVHASSGGS